MFKSLHLTDICIFTSAFQLNFRFVCRCFQLSGTGIGSNGGGGGATRDSCVVNDPCGSPGSKLMSATANQALVGSITKKLTRDIDALSEKLKSEAKMCVS